MKRVGVRTIVNEIKKTGGKFFTVIFRKKKDGTLRVMNCQLNYDNLDGQLSKGLIPVVENKKFRNINIKGIVMASVNGNTYWARNRPAKKEEIAP